MRSFLAATLLAALALQVAAGPTSTSESSVQGLVGARKLATSNDCASVVAFAGIGARAASKSGPLAFSGSLLDKGVGWSKDSGEFTCHCPGLYQFSFAGPAKLALKTKISGNPEWSSVVSTAAAGGANSVLLDLEVGDKASVWLLEDKPLPAEDAAAPSSTFSGHRIAKK